MPEALPYFEAFGNLPTELIREGGRVGDALAADILDMIIIPGGSLVESGTAKGNVEREIVQIAAPAVPTKIDYVVLVEKFKNLLADFKEVNSTES